jgi:hypothetical protein
MLDSHDKLAASSAETVRICRVGAVVMEARDYGEALRLKTRAAFEEAVIESLMASRERFVALLGQDTAAEDMGAVVDDGRLAGG